MKSILVLEGGVLRGIYTAKELRKTKKIQEMYNLGVEDATVKLKEWKDYLK